MGIKDQDETGLFKGEQIRELIEGLHGEIQTLQRVRDFYFKAWKQADKERNEAISLLAERDKSIESAKGKR